MIVLNSILVGFHGCDANSMGLSPEPEPISGGISPPPLFFHYHHVIPVPTQQWNLIGPQHFP